MILAALGTIGYTVLDKFAAEVVQSGPATAARYAYLYFAISFIPYMLLMRTVKEEQGQERPHSWFLAGIGALLGFVLFKEKGIYVRISGAVLITTGLILIALWGA